MVHPNVLDLYAPDVVLKHLLLVPPFLWEPEPEPRDFGDVTVAWLMAVPISDGEIEYARVRGSDALQAELERHQIDVVDIDRAPVA